VSSRASELESPKASGDALEAAVIQRVDALEAVTDYVATWHDAVTTDLLVPDNRLPFYGICLVEAETPVEIKGCQIRTANGRSSARGRFYVKRDAHDQLLEAAGMYLLVVYMPRPGLPQVVRALLPASLLDEHLRGRWYDVDGSRSENQVAKLSWSVLIDPGTVDPQQPIGGGR